MFVALTVTASPGRRPLPAGIPSFATRPQAHRRCLFAASMIGGLTAGSVT